MRWMETEEGIRLEFDDPVTWVWLLQLVALIHDSEPEFESYLRAPGDESDLEQWKEWILPEIESWQKECLHLVEQLIEQASKLGRHERHLLLAWDDLDAWMEVLGRVRLLMEKRWEISKQDEHEDMQELIDALSPRVDQVPSEAELSRMERMNVKMRYHFYGMLEERIVLVLAGMNFPEEEDPLGYFADEKEENPPHQGEQGEPEKPEGG